MSGTRSSGRVTRSTLKAGGEVTNLPRPVPNSRAVSTDVAERENVPDPTTPPGGNVAAAGLRARRRSTITFEPASDASQSQKGNRHVVEVVIPTSPISSSGPGVVPGCAVAGPGPKSMSLRRGSQSRRGSLVEAEVGKTRTSARRREKSSKVIEQEQAAQVANWQAVNIVQVKREPGSDDDTVIVLSPPFRARSTGIKVEEPELELKQSESVRARRSSRVKTSESTPDQSSRRRSASRDADTIILTSPIKRPVSIPRPSADPDMVCTRNPQTPPVRQSVDRTTRRAIVTKDAFLPGKSTQTAGRPMAIDGRPTEGASTASPTSHSLRSTKGTGRIACSVPFPPADIVDPGSGGIMVEDEDELENGSMVQDDMKDDKLMAVCAALETFGNRALTAFEIGEACVTHGWIRPSPALPPQNLVQSAIRAYTRRCASHQPERVCLIRKHILAGYAMESRLIPALHPSAAQDGHRRKGTVYYLEGTVGRRQWTSPFDNLPEEQPASSGNNALGRNQYSSGNKFGSTKQAKARGSAGPSARGQSADAAMADDANADKPKGLKIKIKLGGVVNGVTETPTTRFPPNDDFETMMDQPLHLASSTDEESGSGSDEESEVDQDDFSHAVTDEDSEMDSDESEDARDENGLPTTGSIKDLARSFFMDSPPFEPVADASINHVRFSPFEPSFEPAFPSNPLDGMFDDSDYMPALSPPDGQTGSSSEDEDEVATEFMDTTDTIDFDRIGRRKAFIKRVGFHPMAYRDVLSPGDAEGSEIDTPATTPRTYCDEDEAEAKRTFVATESLLDVDEELQNAVHVLGQLLPDLLDPVDRNSELRESAPDAQEESRDTGDVEMASGTPAEITSTTSVATAVRHRRKSSVGARDLLRLSLPLPLCPVPSPLNSPSLPGLSAATGGTGQDSSAGLDSLSLEPKELSSCDEPMQGTSDLDLMPDLERQLAINDCESACICSAEPDRALSMDVDPISSPRDSVFALDPEDMPDPAADFTQEQLGQSWMDLLGPESVGMEELDNVWGFMNAAVNAAAVDQGKRRRRGEFDSQSIASTKSDSSDRTLQQKDAWGIIGVGSTSDTSSRARRLEKTRFARALMTRTKLATSGTGPSTSPIKSSRTEQPSLLQVEDDEAIGMEDVADAVLSAWADGDTILEEEVLQMSSPDEAVLDEDYLLRAGFQYSAIDEYAIGVSPSALTKSNDKETVTESEVPCALSTNSTSPKAEDAQKVNNPKEDVADRLPVEVTASTTYVNNKIKRAVPIPTSKTSGEAGITARAATTYTKLPARLPAPPRPVTSSTTFVNASKPTYPPVHAMLLDNVSVFAILWDERLIYRRIDSDYVNFSALLRALRQGDAKEIEGKLVQHPTSLILRESKFTGLDGVWLPLDVAETEATAIQTPPALLTGLFREDLAALFPEPLAQIKSILGAQGKAVVQSNAIFVGGRLFGIPFGCMGDAFAKENQNSATTISLSPSLANPPVSKSHSIANVPSKRPNTAATAPKCEGPPSKRRKPSVSIAPARRLTRAQKHDT